MINDKEKIQCQIEKCEKDGQQNKELVGMLFFLGVVLNRWVNY